VGYFEIRLAIVREKIAGLESAEKKRLKTAVQTAVESLVSSGAIHRHNLYGQFNLLEQLARDLSFVTLALTKRIFRGRGMAMPRFSWPT
jgi:hypothetical protein